MEKTDAGKFILKVTTRMAIPELAVGIDVGVEEKERWTRAMEDERTKNSQLGKFSW